MLRRTSVVTLSFSATWQPLFSRRGLSLPGTALAVLVLLFWARTVFAQSSPEDAPPRIVAPVPASANCALFWPQPRSDSDEQSRSNGVGTSLDAGSLGTRTEAKQSKRILWIFRNYLAVSADTQLPPLSLKNAGKQLIFRRLLGTELERQYPTHITHRGKELGGRPAKSGDANRPGRLT